MCGTVAWQLPLFKEESVPLEIGAVLCIMMQGLLRRL